jgi:hypothetical protein
MKKNALLWLLSFLLTIVLVVYQRVSGPTHPVRDTETLAGAKVGYKFYRSWTSGQRSAAIIPAPGSITDATH